MADFPDLNPNYLKFLLASFYLIRRLSQYGVDPLELVTQMAQAMAIDEVDAEVLRYPTFVDAALGDAHRPGTIINPARTPVPQAATLLVSNETAGRRCQHGS